MKIDSKNIGRIVFFKYIGLTFLILSGMMILAMYLSPELNKIIYRNLINPYLNETRYFSIQIVLDLIIVYFIAGKVGKSVIENQKNPYFTVFIGFLKIWIGVLIVAMFSEMILRLIKYGVDFEFIIMGVLIWVIMGGPIFLLIGAAQGGLTSWFIGNEIEKSKTHYNIK